MEVLKCLVAKVFIFTLFHRSIAIILKIYLLFGIVESCMKPNLPWVVPENINTPPQGGYGYAKQ